MQAVQAGILALVFGFAFGFAFDFLSYDGVVFFIVSLLTYPSLTSFSFSLSPYFPPLSCPQFHSCSFPSSSLFPLIGFACSILIDLLHLSSLIPFSYSFSSFSFHFLSPSSLPLLLLRLALTGWTTLHLFPADIKDSSDLK